MKKIRDYGSSRYCAEPRPIDEILTIQTKNGFLTHQEKTIAKKHAERVRLQRLKKRK